MERLAVLVFLCGCGNVTASSLVGVADGGAGGSSEVASDGGGAVDADTISDTDGGAELAPPPDVAAEQRPADAVARDALGSEEYGTAWPQCPVFFPTYCPPVDGGVAAGGQRFGYCGTCRHQVTGAPVVDCVNGRPGPNGGVCVSSCDQCAP